ncbi:MAG TPA: hypothetical protein VNK67_12800 [Burkholderiales bacterium]|nr:hypothetical protein [Burkholderiales bacterium]
MKHLEHSQLARLERALAVYPAATRCARCALRHEKGHAHEGASPL